MNDLKKYIYFMILGLILMLTAFSTKGHGDEDWKKVREKDGVIVHTRDVNSARVKEVKTTTRFNSSLSLLTYIIADVENRSHWFKSCDSVQILKELSPGHFIYHMFIDSPFLTADRDLIQEMKITQDPLSRIVTITLTALPDYLPPIENYVRVPLGDGRWIMSASSGKQVDIEFTYLNDPGKGIPASFINWYMAESPFRTMMHINEEIEEGTYKTGFEWILD